MGQRRKRSRKKKRAPKRRHCKAQKGGTAPFLVNWKKGINLIKDKRMWKLPSMQSDAEKRRAINNVRRYKREYKNSGSNKSYESWLVSKGYATRSSGPCSIM